MICNCIETMNAALVEYNACVSIPLIGPKRPFVTLQKLDEKKRQRPPHLFANFCPFCGASYGGATA